MIAINDIKIFMGKNNVRIYKVNNNSTQCVSISKEELPKVIEELSKLMVSD